MEYERNYNKEKNDLIKDAKRKGVKWFDDISEKKGDEIGRGAFGKTHSIAIGGKEYILKVVDSDADCLSEMIPYLLDVPKHPNLMSLVGIIVKDNGNENNGRGCNLLIERIYKHPAWDDDYQYKSLNVKDMVKIVHGMINGVYALHSAGLVHRDIKPANMIYGSRTPGDKNNSELVLVDYGLMCALEDIEESHLQCEKGPSSGTFEFQPRFAQSRSTYDADIYACGKSIVNIIQPRGLTEHDHYIASKLIDFGTNLIRQFSSSHSKTPMTQGQSIAHLAHLNNNILTPYFKLAGLPPPPQLSPTISYAITSFFVNTFNGFFNVMFDVFNYTKNLFQGREYDKYDINPGETAYIVK